jgi:hypothetical protein
VPNITLRAIKSEAWRANKWIVADFGKGAVIKGRLAAHHWNSNGPAGRAGLEALEVVLFLFHSHSVYQAWPPFFILAWPGCRRRGLELLWLLRRQVQSISASVEILHGTVTSAKHHVTSFRKLATTTMRVSVASAKIEGEMS